MSKLSKPQEIEMNIQTAANKMIHGAQDVIDAASHFIVWAGHEIRLISSNYVAPALKKLWAGAMKVAHFVQNLVKAGPKIPFGIATALFLTGVMAFKMVDRKANEDDVVVKTAWKVLGIAAFVGATLATSIGIAAICTIP